MSAPGPRSPRRPPQLARRQHQPRPRPRHRAATATGTKRRRECGERPAVKRAGDPSAPVKRATRSGQWALIGLCIAVLAGCAGGGQPATGAVHAGRTELEAYLAEVEPIRLAVNRLLSQADPILHAYHDNRISQSEAALRIDRIERKFAAYAVAIAAIRAATPDLRAIHAPYAQTYTLEDSYLSALVAGLANRELGNLPNTQASQRAAIVGWRIDVTVMARQLGLPLPADLQQAGRGEIAPAPSGS
jgi:hypothetical protein